MRFRLKLWYWKHFKPIPYPEPIGGFDFLGRVWLIYPLWPWQAAFWRDERETCPTCHKRAGLQFGGIAVSRFLNRKNDGWRWWGKTTLHAPWRH